MSDKKKKVLPLDQQLEKLNVSGYEKHIFLCGGDSCCDEDVGEAAWKELKSLTAELGLTNCGVFRTKVKCLRVCQGGPIGVVYPGGIWYGNLIKENIERVVREHLIGGEPVTDLMIATNPNF